MGTPIPALPLMLAVLCFLGLVLDTESSALQFANTYAVPGGHSTRRVIEHVVLWQAKVDLDDAAEEQFLYSMWNLRNTITDTQFLAWTVGKIIIDTPQDVRYALWARFPSLDERNKYMTNTVVSDWIVQHLSPIKAAEYGIAFEAEVPNTVESVHKIGKALEGGVEYVLMLTARKAAIQQLHSHL